MIKRRLLGGTLLVFSVCSSYAWTGGCDICITKAVIKANAQLQAAVNATNVAVEANVAATQALETTVTTSTAALQSLIEINTQQYLAGLSAATNKIELTIQGSIETDSRLTDHLVTSLVTLFKQLQLAEQVDKNNKTYHPQLAQPMSGDIGANRAPLLKQSFVQTQQIFAKMVADMQLYSNNTTDVDTAGGSIKSGVLLAEDAAVFDPLPFLLEERLSDEQSLRFQRLLTILFNPVPLKAATPDEMASSPAAVEYELNRKLHNVKTGLAHSVFADMLAQKSATLPLSEADWQQGYVNVIPDESGNISQAEFIRAETEGRLLSEGWFLNIKSMSSAGVLREQVYQQAMNNYLLAEQLKNDRQTLLLEALQQVQTLKTNRPAMDGT
jgi:hypothetical protein